MQQHRIFILLLFLLAGNLTALQSQSLACNALVFYSVSADCNDTLLRDQVLEGTFPNPEQLEVSIDRTLPYGDGPWTFPTLTAADINQTYVYRLKDLVSGVICWGEVKAEDKLPPVLDCGELSVVNLSASGSVVVFPEDLSVLATDNCNTPTLKINGANSVTYNCDDLGVQLVAISATDPNGNTMSCNTAILVQDSSQACVGGCVTNCPVGQVVSYEEGISTLLPAFQNGDNAPFDAFGAPVLDPGCPPSEIIYDLSYTPSADGFNWFERKWDVIIGGNFPFGTCTQTIIFPSTRTFNITGRVFLDSIINCENDPGERGLQLFKVQVKKWPGNETFVVTPNTNGDYAFDITTNGLDSVLEVRLLLPTELSIACPNVEYISATSLVTTDTINFGLFSEFLCPLTEVSLGTNRLRVCAPARYHFKYSNLGFGTADNTYVVFEADPLLSVTGASIPYTQSGDEYTFQLGNLERLTTGSFYVDVLVSCNAVMGQTLCAEATIFPHDPCGGGVWTGPVVETLALCENDSVHLVVMNTGQQSMAVPLHFIVVEDILLRDSVPFILDAGEMLDTSFQGNGATWRIIADQVNGYPYNDMPTSFVEGCEGLNTTGLVNAFANNENARFHDISCEQVLNSYDPNDKAATPTGYGADHTIWANVPLEYKIRFQNTGNDTAYQVVIVDTLSPLLHWATLEAGVSSHSYRLDVLEGGVLRFIFDNINLPDSTTNEAASQGFVQFRVAQQPDLPVSTVIENTAAIYFDFNEPIITNTVFHTIGEREITVSSIQPQIPVLQARVYPNPFSHATVIELEGYTLQNGAMKIFNSTGALVQTINCSGSRCQIQNVSWPAGNYFFLLYDGDSPVCTGKLLVE